MKLPILMYHQIINEAVYGTQCAIDQLYSVTSNQLSEQLGHLSKYGYRTILSPDIANRENESAKKVIVLTFDDGDVSNFDIAYPLLNQLGFKAIFFIITDRIGHQGYMNKRQIKELSSTMEVGSHGKSHRILKNMNTEVLKSEIKGSKTELEEIIGKPVNAFSIPRGLYDNTVLSVARESGYQMIYSSNMGYHSIENNCLAINRIVIRNDYSLEEYKAIVSADNEIVNKLKREMVLKITLRKIVGNRMYDYLKYLLLNLRRIA